MHCAGESLKSRISNPAVKLGGANFQVANQEDVQNKMNA